MLEALAAVLDADGKAALLSGDFEHTKDLLYEAFKAALQNSGAPSLTQIPPSKLDKAMEAGVREVATNAPLGMEAAEGADAIYAEPLGILTSDHVGYLSFDLTRLRPETKFALALAIAARRADKAAPQTIAINIHPYGLDAPVEVFKQARFAQQAIVALIEAPTANLPMRLMNMGGRALQNPGLTDWQLSPASFAASPKSLVGEDGCEQLVPASLALQEFVLRQVVRLTDSPDDLGLPADTRFAYVDEYKVSWFSLGHSLGEILYSLPLAPAESVRLAVIDWSWDSTTKRDEATKLDENILHQTHRDRLISEVVKAGVKELQHGSSFMAGTAGSAGATVGANLGVVGLGGAAGNTFALGGATATSDGSRDVAADNVQRINDSFAQASSAQRALNSTVVIQARQEEKESIQTRTFTNYNHSHTLTILYYEVLRHYRVTVEWMRRRAAILVKIPAPIDDFDAKTLLTYRSVLEPALLDPKLKAGFDAIDKLTAIEEYQSAQGIVPKNDWTPQGWEGNLAFTMFEIGIKTSKSDLSASPVVGYVITADQGVNEKRHELHYVYHGGHMNEGQKKVHNLNSGLRFDKNDAPHFTFCKVFNEAEQRYVSVRWRDIAGFQFEKWGGDDWRIDALTINAFAVDGQVRLLTAPEGWRDVDLYFVGEQPSSQTWTWINRPAPPPPALPPVPSPLKSLSQDELRARNQLLAHVGANKGYYNRAIALSTDTSELAIQFDSKLWTVAGETFADHADPVPLEMFGAYVAYPMAQKAATIDDAIIVDIAAALNGTDPARRQWAQGKLDTLSPDDLPKVLERVALASAKSERLITLPTRGVFAEGKLGHCNLSEEIDNTRFWKWEEHPIPIEAPGINAITPIQPTPQAINPTPTAFPQSLINIVTPSAAPDPTGLGAALGLLATPNIFRDMSGRQEVADLLKKLSDNTISIAEAANKARDIQAKYGTTLDKQQKDFDLGVTQAAAATEGKAIEADAAVETAKVTRANAEASKAEADAKKATVDAANQQAEAAKNVPKPLRAPIYQDAAAALAGNPTKAKVVVFKAKGYNGQDIPGVFSLFVYEAGAAAPIINGDKVGGYGSKSLTFTTATPVLNARATREAFSMKLGDFGDFSQAAITITNDGSSYTVGKAHKTIDILLKQASRDVRFKAKSTNSAVDELMNQWGVELGIDKVVAAKMVANYEKKNKYERVAEEEKSYSFNVPTQNYQMTIASN